jgi:hypothetical protein
MIREPTEVVQIFCIHKQLTNSLRGIIYLFVSCLFSLYLIAKLLILQHSLLLPYASVFRYLGVSRWFLHILLNQVAALVLNKFSLFFLKLYITCACWAFANLTLYIFRATVLYAQESILTC